MVRTLVLAGLLTLAGAATSQAQYRDSYPPDDQYVSEYDTESTYDQGYYDDGYDEELLGSPDYRRGRSEPDVDVGIFVGLGGHGGWHLAADFGWVWRPYASAGWRPYTQGQWVWTSHGWTWVSYEPFGWATYHYGYWTRDPMLGWVWIPGYEWSASRVQFAYYDNYISWAPMPYPGYHCPQPWSTAGINIWFTIGADRFCDPYPARYYVTPKYKSVYKERIAYKSPDRSYVERYTGRSIQKSSVEFKHTTWSKGTKARFDAKSSKSSKSGARLNATSRATKSGTRNFTSPSVGKRSDRVAVQNKSSKQVTRELRAPERRASRQAIKPTRQTRDTRALRAERPSSSKRSEITTRSGGESRRVAKMEQPRREQQRRSIEQPRHEQRASKAMKVSRSSGGDRKSYSVDRRGGGGERKSVTTQRSTGERREVAKSKKSGGREGRKAR